MATELILSINKGDAKLFITSIKDVDGVAMDLSTATELTLYLKNTKKETLKTYYLVGFSSVADKIFQDSATACHICLPKAIIDAYEGKELNVCGVWKNIDAEFESGYAEYGLNLENFVIERCD